METDAQEVERRRQAAEFLKGERERYEYLLQCAEHAEDEELAWETIEARMTIEDFVRAAKEINASREKLKSGASPADTHSPDKPTGDLPGDKAICLSGDRGTSHSPDRLQGIRGPRAD